MARRSRLRQQQGALVSALFLLSAPDPRNIGAAAADAKPPATVSDSQCDCYVTNGSDAAYFTHHKFFDFRSLAQFDGTPGLLQDGGATTNAPVTSSYFSQDSFTSFWQAQNWNNSESAGASNATIMRINSLNNIYIEKNSDPQPASATWMTLRTARQSAFQSTAEIVTQTDSYQFISMRMLARTIGSPGGCTAMFTYYTPPSSSADPAAPALQEVDLEVLTKYPRQHVQCTNQPSLDSSGQLIEEATQNVTLPNGLGWDDWAVYRLDWTPVQSTWYVYGQQIASIGFQRPRDPTRIHINAWSDGSNWTGTMALNTEAHLQIQWWELLYNSTAPSSPPSQASSSAAPRPTSSKDKAAAAGGGGCRTVCSIDSGTPAGQPVVLIGGSTLSPDSPSSSSTSVAARREPSASLAQYLRWLPSVAIALLLHTALSP